MRIRGHFIQRVRHGLDIDERKADPKEPCFARVLGVAWGQHHFALFAKVVVERCFHRPFLLLGGSIAIVSRPGESVFRSYERKPSPEVHPSKHARVRIQVGHLSTSEVRDS